MIAKYVDAHTIQICPDGIGSVMVRLASIRMYTDVLTADEIAQNYNYELSTGRLS
jgi:hypothetical protein